jgi:hypothetical protein
MKGQIRSWWLNALVITVVILMWVTIASWVAVGIVVATAYSNSDTPAYDYGSYDE